MPSSEDIQFGRIALAHNYVTREELAEALQHQETRKHTEGVAPRLGEVLVEMGLITTAQINQIVAEQSGRHGGKKLGGYELLERIGSGGMGAVYRARQISLNRIVALKVLPQRLARDTDFIARFYREARAVAKFSHPNIVSGFDVGEADGYHYLAMEYVDGKSAADMLVEHPAGIPLEQVLDIARQIGRALVHAHEHAIIHRDIKPENILVDKSGTAKLCDLGLARSEGNEDASLTQAGVAVGTPHYISPEQARGRRDLDARADIYSYGATLFHLATGRPLFTGDNALQIMTQHLEAQPPLASDVSPSLPQEFSAFINKTLAKRREDRYESMSQTLEDFELVAAGQAPARAPAVHHGSSDVSAAPARRPHRPPTREVHSRVMRAIAARRKHPRHLLIAAGLGLLIAAGALASVWALGGNRRRGGGDDSPSETPHAPAVPLPPPDAGPTVREKQVKRLFEAAEVYAQEHPHDYAAQAAMFEKVAEAGRPGGNWTARAASRAAEARTRLSGAVASSFATIKAAAREKTAARQYGKAIASLRSLPQDLAYRDSPEMAKLVRSEVKRTQEAGRTDWKRLVGKADRLVAQRKFPEARAVLQPAAKFGLPSIARNLSDKLQEIGSIEALELRTAQERAQKELEAFLPAFGSLVAARKYAEALEKLRQLRARLPAALAAKLDAVRKDGEISRDVYAAAQTRVAGLGENARMVFLDKDRNYVAGTFNGFETGVILLKRRLGAAGYTVKRFEFVSLPSEQILEWAGLGGAPRDPEDALKVLVFTALDGTSTPKQIEEAIGLARLRGLDVSRFKKYVQRSEQNLLDAEASELLARLRKEADGKQWTAALRTAEKLLAGTYDRTPTLTAGLKEIERTRARVTSEIAAGRPTTIVLQQGQAVPQLGVGYYRGTADSSLWTPRPQEVSMGGSASLTVLDEARYRTVIRFALPPLGRDVKLTSAKLSLYCSARNYAKPGSRLRLMLVGSDWQEGRRNYGLGDNADGATWSLRKASPAERLSWRTPGGDVDATADYGHGPGVVAEAPDVKIGSWAEFDVTRAVKEMLDGTRDNFGFLLQGAGRPGGRTTQWYFCSRESLFENCDRRPRLTLTVTGLRPKAMPAVQAPAEEVFTFASPEARLAFESKFRMLAWPGGQAVTKRFRYGGDERTLRLGGGGRVRQLVSARKWGRDLELSLDLTMAGSGRVGVGFKSPLPDSGCRTLIFLTDSQYKGVQVRFGRRWDHLGAIRESLATNSMSSNVPVLKSLFNPAGRYELRIIKQGCRMRLEEAGRCLAEIGLSPRDEAAVSADSLRILTYGGGSSVVIIRIGQLAVKKGLITGTQLAEILKAQEDLRAATGQTMQIGDLLVERGLVERSKLQELLQTQIRRGTRELGGFELISRLGAGGMGAVYKAKQKSMDRLVALKVLPPKLAKDQSFIERFFREARSVAKLNHQNIVQGIDVGEASGYYYLAMEFVQGSSLRDIIQKCGPMAEEESLDIIEQVSKGLHHAHVHGLIHRDVKPDNVLIDTQGVAKLCDLGLARQAQDDSSLTQTGVALGTPHYIAPEQARGEDVDARADLYSLGATWFHMLAGRPPFVADNALAVITKHLTEPVPPLSSVRGGVSPAIEAVVTKLMAKEASGRYMSAAELLEDIADIRAGRQPRLAGGPAGASARTMPLRKRDTRQHAVISQRAMPDLPAGLGLAGTERGRRRPGLLSGRPAQLALAAGVLALATLGTWAVKRAVSRPEQTLPDAGPEDPP
ncbi:MAG: protein kinase domain-containing protein, partial [Planctomycetota bacterium]